MKNPKNRVRPQGNGQRRRFVKSLIGAGAAGAAGKVISADVAEKSFDLARFEAISLDVPATLNIRIGDASRLRILAEQKVIDAIDVKVTDGTLLVVTSGSFSTQKPIEVQITTASLKSLKTTGAGDVSIDALESQELLVLAADSTTIEMKGLNLESLKIDISGGAAVSAEGSSQQQKITISEAGEFDGGSLNTAKASIIASGASEVFVSVKDELVVEASEAASIQYSGSPAIRQTITDAAMLESL